jgi:citrate lyase subunit beta/citryl-CoA lyase
MQLAVRLAAAEAGVWACDTVYGTVSDPEGYTREAQAARRLGFIGKSCVHPTQVPLANVGFRPTDAEIAAALRVVAAARGAETNGVGGVPGRRPHDRHSLHQACRGDPRRRAPARPGPL